MTNKTSSLEIKNKFLNYFKNNDHMQISDSSIVPKNDPTLLFINSGMAPLKNYFTGEENPPYKRLCNVQPCIRTIDIDSIGDKHHLTSFQMLGSWSIGDYFKEKAVELAYSFLTKNLKIPEEKLYVTVFSGDEKLNIPFDKEAYDAWRKIGVPEERIVRCGTEDNFWGPTAETGPCGPCTEIFYDTGEGVKYVENGEFDTKNRYIEIWNAGVFMQFNKNSDKTFSRLSFNSVDTGAGLERLSMVLNNCKSVYDTDLLAPIRDEILKEFGENAQKISEKEVLILTDHLRTVSLIMSEKIAPSNEGRGYIPRKLIRRCMMIVFKNNINNFNFLRIIEFIIDNYNEIYSNFNINKEFILKEFKLEHDQFKKVLTNGLEKLENFCAKSRIISGEDAFDLVTTYGLPFDIIKQYCDEKAVKIDENEYIKKIEAHKEISKISKNNSNLINLEKYNEILSKFLKTEFSGYEKLRTSSEILGIIKDNNTIESGFEGEQVGIILKETCMYAESGGQCSDFGVISGEDFQVKIDNVQKTKSGVFVHFGEILNGKVKVGDKVKICIDEKRRAEISANHTAVHLLHSVLRECYGKELHQAGSKVEDKKLRFDFNYDKNLQDFELEQIEIKVNNYIRENIARVVEEKTLDEAVREGAMALFESKYGEKVRVVKYGNISSELCGGTHIDSTGRIGLFKIVSSEGIGKGIRRITAVTGNEALVYVQNKIRDFCTVSKIFKVKPENLVEKAQKMSENINNKNLDKNDSNFEICEKDLKILNNKLNIDLRYVKLDKINKIDKKMLNEIVKIVDKMNIGLVCVCGVAERTMINVVIADSLVDKIGANEIFSNIMKSLNGKGGGNKKIASGATGLSSSDVIKKLADIMSTCT